MLGTPGAIDQLRCNVPTRTNEFTEAMLKTGLRLNGTVYFSAVAHRRGGVVRYNHQRNLGKNAEEIIIL